MQHTLRAQGQFEYLYAAQGRGPHQPPGWYPLLKVSDAEQIEHNHLMIKDIYYIIYYIIYDCGTYIWHDTESITDIMQCQILQPA